MERLRNVVDPNAEIRRIEHRVGTILLTLIGRLILGLHMIIDGLGSQVDMQLARLAIQTRAIVIEDAVSEVGRLLDLGQQNAATDGVNTARRKVKHIASLHLMARQHIGDGAILNAFLKLIVGDLRLEARI